MLLLKVNLWVHSSYSSIPHKWLNRYLAASTTNKDTSQQCSTRRFYSSTVQMIYKGPSLGKLGPTCTSFYSLVCPFFRLPTKMRCRQKILVFCILLHFFVQVVPHPNNHLRPVHNIWDLECKQSSQAFLFNQFLVLVFFLVFGKDACTTDGTSLVQRDYCER